MKRPARIALWVLGSLIGLLLITVTVGIYVVQTDWFKNKIRDKIVSVVETATGGKAEIGAFRYDWRKLTAEVSPFIVHGTEPAGAKPLLRADSIQVGIKIISLWKKDFDIASLVVTHPEIHIYATPDGKNNLPSPKIAQHSDKNIVETILDLKVRHFEVHDGLLAYNDKKTPLELEGDRLNVNFAYDGSGPRYKGDISSHQMHVSSPQNLPVAFDLDAKVALEKDRLQIYESHLQMDRSKVTLSGTVLNLAAPKADLDLVAHLAMADLAHPLELPVAHQGDVDFKGKAEFTSDPLDYKLDGKVAGHDLAYRSKDLSLNRLALSADLLFTPKALDLNRLQMTALDGGFAGSAHLEDMKRFKLDGQAHGLSVQQLGGLAGQKNLAWNGLLSGPVHVQGTLGKGGVTDLIANAKMEIVPAKNGLPLQGSIDLAYDQRAGLVRLGTSHVHTGATDIELTGTLGQQLHIHLVSRNLNDLLPAYSFAGEKPPKELPIRLRNGVATLDANITGPLRNPRIVGSADVTSFTAQNRDFDHAASSFDLTRSGVTVQSLAVDQGSMHLTGAGQLALVNWKPSENSPASGSLNLRDADVKRLLAENKSAIPLTGTASATVNFNGTFSAPSGTALIQASNVGAYGEKFDRVRADLKFSGGAVELLNGSVELGKAKVQLSGAYTHPGTDWMNGKLRFDVASQGFTLAQFNNVQKFRKGLDAEVSLKANGNVSIVKGSFDLDSLRSQASLRNATIDGKLWGNLDGTANTNGQLLDVRLNGDLRDTHIQGNGQWRLEGDYPGQGHLDFSRLTFALAEDMMAAFSTRKDLQFDGYLEGGVTVSGPLKKVDALQADVVLTALQVNPNRALHPRAGSPMQDIVLRNSGPIEFLATTKGVDIKRAQLTAKDTSLQATGHVSFTEGNALDVRVNGNVNLAILQLFDANLLASGVSVINANVRGTLSDPKLNGRLELKNASLYLSTLPNGLDNANGLVLFDANRATIQKLTAESGGGKISLDGYVGFASPSLVYRLRASADHVRLRYPQGVSFTVNSTLTLVGTSATSLLSGTLTVIRAGFNPRTDVGGLLATTSQPVATPSSPSEFLQGVQLDVRVESAQSLELQTSLTRDLQAEANLRVRGTLDRPAVTGNISVDEGEIQFFGNKYTINRGEVNFFNPTKIEPIIDLDLETRVRGVTVNITFSGPITKLNTNYRSDPPLQSGEIIALLAVGRDPSTNPGLASSQTTSQTGLVASGTNALLGQALAAPVSNRLQRFFGVSHLKIDPLLTDLNTTPQARLTLEQQISKDITLTYVTNLTTTQEQIIRVEWDLNKQWSLVALRDANGAFGIDVQYRKRFK